MPATEFVEPDLLFRLPEERLFAFAVQWDEWKGPEGELVQSCTMLTTAMQAIGDGVLLSRQLKKQD